jgi:hypothetical protein
MTNELKPRLDVANETAKWRQRENNREQEMWQAIKDGTFVSQYTKDMRTALQKAIDRHETTIHVQRKKDIEDGDLEMFDGKGWTQFCIHKAKKLINEDKIYIGIRERVSGIWVDYAPHKNDVFNNSLRDKPEKKENDNIPTKKGISYEKPINHPLYGYLTESQYYNKMHKEEEAAQLQDGLVSSGRRFI